MTWLGRNADNPLGHNLHSLANSLRQMICGRFLLQLFTSAVAEEADSEDGGNPQQGSQHSLVQPPYSLITNSLSEAVQSPLEDRTLADQHGVH